MTVPFVLLVISLGIFALSLLVPGFADLSAIAALMGVASLILLVLGWGRQAPTAKTPPRWVIVDGSNVLHWAGMPPGIAPLRDVLARLAELGYTPGVVFDANVGYLVAGQYRRDRDLGRMLGLPTDRVMVANKGEPADPLILKAAQDLNARIVTNDRYRDWADRFAQVGAEGFLIRGGYRDGKLWLDIDSEGTRRLSRAT